VRITATRQFKKDLDRVPDFIREKAMFWIELVELLGLPEVRKRKGFHDEPLRGVRMGQRSVRLNRAYRLIYLETTLQLLLLEVNKHEY
jgi:toxin HigB-1